MPGPRLVPRRALSAALLVAVSFAGCDREGRARAQPLAVGDTVRGALEQGDWTDVFADRSYTDLYQLRLRGGQRVVVEMRSSDFDTYLSLMRGPGDQVVDNDDAEEGRTDSRIDYTSPTDFEYFVAATSFRSGASGAYTLTVREAPEAGGDGARPPPSSKGR